MSLVSTYVYATDGKFYKDPTIRGEGWLICFDDDDPPELVVERELYRKSGKEVFTKILQEQKLNFKMIRGSITKGGSRCFSDSFEADSFRPACSAFFALKGPIQPPPGMVGVDIPNFQCCVEGIGMKDYAKLMAERKSDPKKEMGHG